MLSFTNALILFSLAQTAILLWLLVNTRDNGTFRLSERVGKVATKTAPILATTLFITTWLVRGFRESLPYYIVLFASTVLIILSAFAGGRNARISSLYSIVFWHLSVYLGAMPQVDIAIGEDSEMTRALAFNDHWRFKWAHNPSYNPLPTIAFVKATLAKILNVPWYSYSLNFFFSLAWWITYDLIIYALTYIITRSSTASLLATILVVITPLTPIHQHPYQWSSDMLWLASLLAIFKSIQYGRWNAGSIIAITLLFLGSYLAHITGIAFAILLFVSWICASFLKRIVVTIERFVYVEDLNSVTTFERIFLQLLPIAILSLLIRILLPVGTPEYVLPTLQRAIISLINTFGTVFIPSVSIRGGTTYTPLYERANVNPIQAYSWALAISAAISWVLYRILRRKISYTEIVMVFLPLIVIGYVFLSYAVFKEPGAYSLNRTSYVFVPLLYPFAALAITRVAKRGRIFAIFSILMIGLGAVIASHDPNISPLQYVIIRHATPITLTRADILKAQFIVSHLRIHYYETEKLYFYSLELFRTGEYKRVGIGGIWVPVVTCRLEKALKTYLFIEDISAKIRATTISSFNNTLSVIFSDGKTFIMIFTRRSY